MFFGTLILKTDTNYLSTFRAGWQVPRSSLLSLPVWNGIGGRYTHAKALKGNSKTFCYSGVHTSEYFHTAFCCPADLVRGHLCCPIAPHVTSWPPSSPTSTVSPQRCLAFSLSVAKHKGTVILGLLVTIATAFSTFSSPFQVWSKWVDKTSCQNFLGHPF